VGERGRRVAILARCPGASSRWEGFSLGTRFDDLVLELAVGPRVLFVPTAAGDAEWISLAFHESFGPRAEPAHLSFNPWPPEDLRDVVLAHDVVYVSGGNTVNALAVWRVHGSTRSCARPGSAGAALRLDRRCPT
jgi:peptidase E